MAKIEFEKIEIKNFQSYGDNPTTFHFNKSSSTLIKGLNRSGKSTIIEGFIYCLSGRSYRGSPVPRLINTINQKDCLTKLFFNTEGHSYVINRGMKPNIFYIEKDGKKIDETASIRDMQKYLETHILKTSVSGIISTCVLGCNYRPFMEMTPKEKREMVDILLDVADFGEMAKSLKTKISNFKDEYTEYQTNLKLSEKDVESKRELLAQAKLNKESIISNDKDELKTIAKRLKSIEADIAAKQKVLDSLIFHSDIEAINVEYTKLDKDLYLINSNIKSTSDSIKKFTKLGSYCNECGQDVSKEHTEKHITEYNDTLVKLKENKKELEIKIKNLNSIKQEYNEYIKNRNAIELELNGHKNALESTKKMAIEKVKKHKNLHNEEKPDVEKYNALYDSSIVNLKELQSKESYYSKMKVVYQLAVNLLKDDGIKSNIVNQYIPVLSQYINYYIKVMNFGITFNIDKNLDVRLDGRYQDEFVYTSLSMGERQRIDLSITFAWRKVASLKNSVSTNVLFMDETFDASLDTEGTDDLLTIIDDFKKEGVNVFVISHKGNLDDKLRSTVTIEKRNGFSKLI